jgi:hypothetical protein
MRYTDTRQRDAGREGMIVNLTSHLCIGTRMCIEASAVPQRPIAAVQRTRDRRRTML